MAKVPQLGLGSIASPDRRGSKPHNIVHMKRGSPDSRLSDKSRTGRHLPTLDNNKLAISARSGRPSTNREVPQTPDTVFAINPEEWNNVPKVVYEACYALVVEADATRKRNAHLQAEVKNNFMESRTSVRNVEQAW